MGGSGDDTLNGGMGSDRWMAVTGATPRPMPR
ncbi:hypothetical protein ACFSHQ_12300 [Gemmobacter lanyuensis]